MSQHNHIVSQDRIIASQRIEIENLNDKLFKISTALSSCKSMLQDEKLRADLLQKDLDKADLIHFDEEAELESQIEFKIKECQELAKACNRYKNLALKKK